MGNVTWELLALDGALVTALLVCVWALRVSSKTNAELSSTLGSFSQTLESHNRERENWQAERTAWVNERTKIGAEMERLRREAREQEEHLATEIAALKALRKQEEEQRRALEAQVCELRALLEQERRKREELERQVADLQKQLERERKQRQQAERDKALLEAERNDIRRQLDELRAALESKADKKNHLQSGGGEDGDHAGTVAADRDGGRHDVDGVGDTGGDVVAQSPDTGAGETLLGGGERARDDHPGTD